MPSGHMLLTLLGVFGVGMTALTYAFEDHHRGFVLAFAAGCVLSSAYGFLAGAWPFGVVEIAWAVLALRRFTTAPRRNGVRRANRRPSGRSRSAGYAPEVKLRASSMSPFGLRHEQR